MSCWSVHSDNNDDNDDDDGDDHDTDLALVVHCSEEGVITTPCR